MNKVVGPKVLQMVADGKAGGGTTFVLGLSEHLSDCGFQVCLVTEPESYAAEQAALLGIDVHPFNFFKWPRGGARHRQLERKLAEFGAQLIHFHGPRAALPGTLAIRSWNVKPRTVYTVHGYHFRQKKLLPKFLGYAAERLIQRSVDAVVHVSAADAAFAQQNRFAWAEHSHIILNGVGELPHSIVALPERYYDVTFAARFVRQKNPVFAAQVLRALAERGYQVCMVGDGELRPEVQAALGDSTVTQLGALSHAKTTEVLANSRILMLPSLWEGLPLTPMESMMSGGVVVASNIHGNNEVVKPGETGLLIDGFDTDVYVKQISALLDNHHRMEQLGGYASTVARQQFTKRRCFDEYTAMYQQLLAIETKTTSHSI